MNFLVTELGAMPVHITVDKSTFSRKQNILPQETELLFFINRSYSFTIFLSVHNFFFFILMEFQMKFFKTQEDSCALNNINVFLCTFTPW